MCLLQSATGNESERERETGIEMVDRHLLCGIETGIGLQTGIVGNENEIPETVLKEFQDPYILVIVMYIRKKNVMTIMRPKRNQSQLRMVYRQNEVLPLFHLMQPTDQQPPIVKNIELPEMRRNQV